MKREARLLAGTLVLLLGTAAVRSAEPAPGRTAAALSPIYSVAIPKAYRSWELIAPATEDAPCDELRVVLGNRIAADAFHRGARPFPDRPS